MTRLGLLVFALALHFCSAHPVYEDFLDAPEDTTFRRVLSPEYRLPEDFTPISYIISIKPYFLTGDSKSFTFDGRTVITFTPLKTISRVITLHAKDLTITQMSLTVLGEARPIAITSTPQNQLYDFLYLNLGESLNPSRTYELIITYTGKIRDDMSGFYRSSYIQDGVTKWLGTTQMQPVSARTVFPCFDEPMYKATFTIIITRPKSFKPSLSNMPIETTAETASEVTETFYKTPIMSTYLVAFIVSEFEAAAGNENKTFGIWARPGAKTMGKYPFENGRGLVEAMDNYTGVGYYSMDTHIKMDQAGLPDFSAGAMENWGLLTYREPILMYHEEESSVRYRQQISTIMAHEIAHMWFGDLVTCHWWSDTWLNEGFATFFEFKLPDAVQKLDMATQFVTSQVHAALSADTSIYSSPLTNPGVNTPSEINNHFSTISYSKGGSVLRMIENWIGEESFKRAVNRYLTTNNYSVVTPEKLFVALQNQTDDDGSLEGYPGSTVASVMASWTVQSGYPLLDVNINYETGIMNLTQTRMTAFAEETSDTLYHIPITFATKNQSQFDNTKPITIMSQRNIKLNKGIGLEWVVFNKKQTGFYRVNYDSYTWQILSSALNSASRTEIHTLNRAQIVDDLLNLARENVTDYASALNVIQFLEMETDYAPWTAAFAGFSSLRRKFALTPTTLSRLDFHILELMKVVIEAHSFEEVATDAHLKKMLRASTWNFACQLGHKECTDKSMDLLNGLVNNNARIHPNIRPHVYCSGLRTGNESHFDFLWNKYLTENVANEQLVILNALGCTKHENSLMKFLTETINENSTIKDQNLMTAFNSALTGNDANVEVVFSFFKMNVNNIRKAYGSVTAPMLNIIGRMKGTQLHRMSAFIKASVDLTSGEKASATSAMANVALSYEWAHFHKDIVETWIHEKYNSGASAILSSAALLAAMLSILFSNNQ